MKKKLLGYTFIVLAVIFIIIAIGQLPYIVKAVLGLIKIFSGTLDSYEAGRAAGAVIYWVLHFLLIVTLLRYGRRWIKNKEST